MITIGGLKKILYTSFVFAILVLFFILPIFSINISIFVLLFINILFVLTNLIKIILFIIGLYKNNINNYYVKDNLNIKDDDLPIYTILLPVRNEKYIVINNLLNSLYNLDYPQDKLDIKTGLLSGGQRQALALVMSTMTKTDLLLLDEHTAALDPKTAEIIMRLTDKVVKEKNITVLMVTHNLRFAVEYGNRTVMMHKGQIVIDKGGKDKENLKVSDLLGTFNEISVEEIKKRDDRTYS